MKDSKQKTPQPNYTISLYRMGWDDKIWRFWLDDSKEFYSEKEIKEITYWKGKDKCITIQKYDPNEVQKPRKRASKRSDGNKTT